MSIHLKPFIYKLRIVNRTLSALDVSMSLLIEGMWFRDGADGEGPVAVQPWSDAEVLGIRGLRSGTRGYAFECAWGCEGEGGEPPTRIRLAVTVPFLGGKNKAGLDTSSRFKIEGWNGIPLYGHAFEQVLTLSYRA